MAPVAAVQDTLTWLAETGAATTPVGATATIQIAGAPAVAAYLHTDLQGPAQGDQQWFGEVVDGCATTYAVDLSQGILPWVGTASLSTDATKVHVPMTGGSGGELLYTMVEYTHGTQVVQWEIAGPVATDTALPILPGDLAQYQPAAGDAVNGVSAWVLDWGLGGYDAVREQAIAIGEAGDSMLVPVSGRVRGSYRIQ